MVFKGRGPRRDQERLWGRGHLNKQSKGVGRGWRNCTSEGGGQESTRQVWMQEEAGAHSEADGKSDDERGHTMRI